MMKSDPWLLPLPFAPLRCVWIIYFIFLGPTIFSSLELSMGASSVLTMLVTLPACIGTSKQLGIKKLQVKDILLIIGVYFVITFCVAISDPVWKMILKKSNIDYAPQQDIAESLCSSTLSEGILLFMSTCFLTPIVEEVLFRRIIYGWFTAIGRKSAVIITSIIFSLMHFFILGIPGLFFMGLGFQFVYLFQKNLLTAILLHSLVNTMACIAMFFKVSLEQLPG